MEGENELDRIPRVLGALVLTIFFSAAGCAPKPPALIPREVLFGLPEKVSPQISTDGMTVAFLAPSKGVLNIWLYDRAARKERVLTRDEGRGIHFYTWAPDGRSVIFLQDQGGDENWHLYQIPLAGGKAKDLTPFEGVQARVLSIDKHFPNQILIELNKDNAARHDAYRLDLRTGALELAARNDGQVSEWIVDPEMKIRGAFTARPAGGHDVLIRDSESLPWRKVLSWEIEDSMTGGVIGFSKDGQSLYLTDSRGTDTTRLVLLDLRTGEVKNIFSDPAYDVGGVVMNPDDRELDMVSVYRARNEWTALRESVQVDLEALRKINAGDLLLVNRSHDDRYWVVGFNNDVTPLKYYIYDRKTRHAEYLFTHRPALLRYQLAPMKPVSFLSRDGLRLEGYLTLPKQGESPFPMVLVVHGGPWARDGWGYDPEVQWLADRGYACLQVNFRGSTGYGKAFVNAGDKEWGRKMQEDLSDAVTWATREGVADPDRVGIMGASYGGYAALAGAAFTPKTFRCAIDMFGPSDLATLIRAMPPYWSIEKSNIMRRMGDPDTEAVFLKSRSPLFFTDKIRIPLLIAQGANDPRTPRAESDRMVKSLRQRKIDCEYVIFPDEGHGFLKPANRLRFYGIAEDFLARHLQGRREP